MRTELISIIIPTYNRGHIVLDTLKSIQNQSYTAWECIIVDDGSTDNTENIINELIIIDSRFKYYKRPKKLIKGPNTCRNFGFSKSKGAWIKWLDSDDLLHKNCLKQKVNFIEASLDAVICKVELTHFGTSKFIKENKIYSRNLITDYLTNNISFYVSGPLWNKKFLDKQPELFDVNISNLDDWDFNLRMLYHKPKMYFLNERLVQYRRHENSLSNEIGKLNLKEIKSEFYARDKHVCLLKSFDKKNAHLLNLYIIKRYRQLLHFALIRKNSISKYLFNNLVKHQYVNANFFGLLKSTIGYLFYKMFNKGYIFFKTK